MIENIRRYTGLIFVVIVVLLLGFIFMDTSSFFGNRAAGGRDFLSIQGRKYTDTEFTNLGVAPFELAQNLPVPELTELARDFISMREPAGLDPAERFFVGRVLLRDARDRFGVHPSDEEVARFIEGLMAFQKQPPPGSPPGTRGGFDQRRYNEFIERFLGRLGMNERNFQELIRDVIASQTLRQVVGSGLAGDRRRAEAGAIVNLQQLTLDLAEIDKAAIRDSFEPDDEELRAFWDERKEAFQTDRRVKLSYLLLSPEETAAPEEEEAEDAESDPSTSEEDTEGEASENESPEDTGDAAEEAADPEQEALEQRQTAARELAVAVDQFITELYEKEGANFDALAADNDWAVSATDWFTADSIPPALQLQARGSSRGRDVGAELLGLRTGPDPLARFSRALAVGENQWLIARLDEVEEPRTKTFEEAREEARELWVEQQTKEAVEARIEELTTTLEEQIEGGASFEEAAASLELDPRRVSPFGISASLDGEIDARALFNQAKTTNPDEFTEPLVEEDRVLLIRVVAREIEKDDNRGLQVDNELDMQEYANRGAAFRAWLDQAAIDARIDGPALLP